MKQAEKGLRGSASRATEKASTVRTRSFAGSLSRAKPTPESSITGTSLQRLRKGREVENAGWKDRLEASCQRRTWRAVDFL
jgi:hypothetical protein